MHSTGNANFNGRDPHRHYDKQSIVLSQHLLAMDRELVALDVRNCHFIQRDSS